MAYKLFNPEPQQEQQSTLGTIASKVGRGLARASVEIPATAAALPRQIITAGSQGLDYLLGALGAPKEITGRPEFQKGPEFLPSYPELKETIGKTAAKHLPEGALRSPETRPEKAFDEFVHTVTSLVTPFPGGALNLAKAAKISAFGQGAKEFSKLLGASDETANFVKLGAMIPASIYGTREEGIKLSKQHYKTAEKAIKDIDVPSAPVKNIIDPIYNKVAESAGPGMEATEKILKPIITRLSKEGTTTIPVQKLWDYKKDMNAWLSKYNTPKEARPYIKLVSGKLDGILEDYGKTNPEFLQSYNIADQLHGAFANKSILKQFTEAHPAVSSVISHPLTKFLFYGPKKAIAIGGAILSAPVAAYKVASIMNKSPEARKLYIDAINNALKQDVKAYVSDVGKLDKILGKEEKNTKRYKLVR